MATRGRKPKSPALRLVEGNPGKRPIPDAVEPGEVPDDFERADIAKPAYLRGRAAKLWAEVAAMCWWLGDADIYKLGLWCALQAEFERGPAKMTAARINSLRALGSELGLDPASRARLGSMKGNRKPNDGAEQGKNPAADYF